MSTRYPLPSNSTPMAGPGRGRLALLSALATFGYGLVFLSLVAPSSTFAGLVSTSRGNDTQDDPKQPPAAKPKSEPKVFEYQGLKFYTLEDGLKRSSESLRPLVVIYPGLESQGRGGLGLGEGTKPNFESVGPLLESQEKYLKECICAVVTQPVPARAKKSFGEVTQFPTIFILDRTPKIVERWNELPKNRVWKRALRKAIKRSLIERRHFVQLEKLVAKSLYAIKTNEYREACLAYLEGAKLKVPKQAKPAQDLIEARKQIDEIAEKRFAEADELENNNKLLDSVQAYEKIVREFPIPELQKRARRNITRIWQKIRPF